MSLSTKRARSPSSVRSPQDIYRSASITEQTSVFVAAFSPSLSAKALQNLAEFRTATHRIAAWRARSRQRSLMPATKILYDLGHDDDGEKWAGGRLAHVLDDMGVEGAVVVARWYGGQNIGPIRFTHIENAAKESVWKYQTADAESKRDQVAKKQRRDEETAKRELEENLKQRDANIFVLRRLLAEKKAELEGAESVPPTPQKGPPDYGKMSMEALKRVDKARDATIAFVLKEIDKAEENLKLLEVLDDAARDEGEDDEVHISADPTTPKDPRMKDHDTDDP